MSMSDKNGNRVVGGYREVETLDDPGGAHAVISQRQGHNLYTVAFFRKYDRDGELERTAFFGPTHFESLKRMVSTAEKRIAELMNGSANKSVHS